MVSTVTNNTTSINDNTALQISEKFGISKIIAKILVLRGVDSLQKAEKFIQCGLKNLYDPFLLDGMTEAVKKINYYLSEKKSIVIYGDYDADGICSVAILYLYFLSKNANVNWYIPEREEGYGINADAVDFINLNYKPDVIISVDCGVTAVKEVEYIKSLGIDIIVTDHHNSCGQLPDCIVINPKLSPTYPFKDLCGGGVALKIVQALGGESEAKKYIDIATIATVADSVELTGENRDIVFEGLKTIKESCRKGIKILYEISGQKDNINTCSIAFGLVPRINAAGRIGEAKRALALFYEQDEDVLKQLCKELNEANILRQKICEEIMSSAKEQINLENMVYSHCIVVTDDSCHDGVSGIVASKLCEDYYRPTFVFCEYNGMLKGSGRSVEGVNIFDMLTSMSGLFEKFGGHAYAAGVTIKKENLELFKQKANDYLEKNSTILSFTKQQAYDYDLTGEIIEPDFVKQLNIFEPCGMGNLRPRFLCRVNGLNAQPLKNYPQHLSFKLFDINFIAFNFGNSKDILNSKSENSLLLEFTQSVYKGKMYDKGFLKDFNYNYDSPSLEAKIKSNYILQAGHISEGNAEYEVYKAENINSLLEAKFKFFGTLIVVFDKITLDLLYEKCTWLKNVNLSVFSEQSSNNVSKVLLSPDINIVLSGYDNIIFYDIPFSKGYINRFKTDKNTIYIPDKKQGSIIKADDYILDRDTFKLYYKMITDKQLLEKPYINAGNYYFNLSQKYQKTSLIQFSVCILVFIELEFIYINDSGFLVLKDGSKKELESSEIYQKLKKLKNI